MVHPLYYVIDLVFALVLVIMLHHGRKLRPSSSVGEDAFDRLIKWVIFFCLQDAVWGLCASELVSSDLALYISSSVFHISTVTTTYFWLYFILSYLSVQPKTRRTLLLIDNLVIAFQVALIVINCFTPTIFTVENGDYITAYLRPFAFFNQYVVYLAMSIVSAICMFSSRKQLRERYLTVFIFSLAPVMTGVFQLLYPDGPFYSMGYFLGTYIINVYVISQERSEFLRLQQRRAVADQRRISNTDPLTGLGNRRLYESFQAPAAKGILEDDYIYISLDINGLKTVNDTLGHEAGDELIRGAADCMKQCLGAYGRVYRIGGDEFAAIIYASDEQLTRICEDLEETVMKWKGDLVKEMSISYGIVTKREFDAISSKEIARIADERMYAAKEAYYSKKGVDRKGLQSAYTALCDSYTKILKVNISDDTYRIIRMDTSEQTVEKGFADSISTWLHDFGTSGQVHADDLENYLKQTRQEYINEFFDSTNKNLTIFYRRKSVNGFRQTKMEMIPAEDYSNDKKSLYLYVKDIDK